MHEMGHGACTVLGGRGGVLMVDCGSANLLLPGGRPFKAYVQQTLAARYLPAPRRAFLLTHFHRDHACGLFGLLAAHPGYFDEVYLPCMPYDAYGSPLLLEFALLAWAVLPRQAGLGQVNCSALTAFQRLRRQGRAGAVRALGQGDTFWADGVEYACLWPPRDDFPFDAAFCDALGELRLLFLGAEGPCVGFWELLRAFCRVYGEMCAGAPVQPQQVDRAAGLLARMDALTPSIRRLPAARQAAALLGDRDVRGAYAAQANAAGLVFHNVRAGRASVADVLMTGDAPPQVFSRIQDLLCPDYYAVQAPHHGAASGFSPVVAGRGAHVLVSAGPGAAGGVAQDWPALAGGPVLHCTSAAACAFWREGGCGCARAVYCGDQPRPGPALRCPGNRGALPPCGIRVVAPDGRVRGCICDPAAQAGV